MIGKYFQLFVYVLLYFAAISLIGITLVNNYASSSTMVTFIISSIVLFIPAFIFMGKKVFMWKAKNTSPISIKEIEEGLSRFAVDGLSFSYESASGAYLLSPFEYSMSMINQRSRVKFYVKLWLDDANKKATFCDYLIETKRETDLISSYFSFGKTRQKGMIFLHTTAASSDGTSFKFSTAAVHDELINLFTKNGWDLQGKVF